MDAITSGRRLGCCHQGDGLFAIKPQIPQKPTPRLLFLAPVGPFVFWGIWENRRVEIEQRAGEVGFGDLGGLKSSVVEELEGAVVD